MPFGRKFQFCLFKIDRTERVQYSRLKQSASKHGRRTFLCSAMRELVCDGQLWTRGSFAVTRSDSKSIFQQQFGEYHGYDGCYSIYFVSSTIVRLSGLLQKVSNDDTWACWCIFLRKRAGIDKMDYHIFRRKYLLGCLGKLREVLYNSR